MKSSSTAVAAHMLKFLTAGMGVRAPRPKANTSHEAASVIDGPAEPRARPALVVRGSVGSCNKNSQSTIQLCIDACVKQQGWLMALQTLGPDLLWLSRVVKGPIQQAGRQNHDKIV